MGANELRFHNGCFFIRLPPFACHFQSFSFCISPPRPLSHTPMFSHVVIFWTDPNNPKAADELIAGANKFLKPIPGVLQYHIGKMATSHRPVVDLSYQVA